MGNRAAPPEPMDLVRSGVRALGRGAGELFEEVVAALLTAPIEPLERDLTAAIEVVVADRWEHGWQPIDLHRAVARELGALEARLVAQVIAAESRSRRALARQVMPHWVHQADALDDGLERLPPGEGADWVDRLVGGMRLLRALEQLPDLPLVEPPPSAWHSGMGGAVPALRGRVPAAVGALLAEAGSSASDADAEARTATAQELLTRHRLDDVAAQQRGHDGPQAPFVGGRRIRIEAPYAGAKATLLAGICVANGARAVWTEVAGASTAFGSPVQLDAVEALFESLVVQSSGALRRAGSKRDRFGRSRTTRFRRSFLDDFAQGTARRLRSVVDATVDADGRHLWLRPVLAEQEAAVASAVATAFPDPSACTPTLLREPGLWVEQPLFDVAIGC